MKILLLHQYFLEEDDPGGSRWNEMTKVWTAAGHEVSVIAGMMHYGGSEKRKEYKRKYLLKKRQGDVLVYRTHVSETYNSGFLGRLWGYFSFMFWSIFVGFFKMEDRYDVVIVTSPPLFVGFSGYLISRMRRIPMVFEVRDLWPESAVDTGVLTNTYIIRLAYWFEKFIYKRAELINVLTPAFYNTLIQQKNVAETKLIMIPNAADFTLSEVVAANFNRDEFRKSHDLDGRFVITYVGAHGLANHLQQILEAGKHLEDTDVLFLLIGNGMEKENLKAMAVEMKVINVRFVDPVPKSEVFKYIMASEMGASVLKNVETFKTVYSNKTFDYFSCKKPVLMAIDGVSRQLIEDADAGTYVEPENIEEYGRVIRSYLTDPNKLRRQGENGYQYAKENFDRRVLAEKFLEHITRDVIGEKL